VLILKNTLQHQKLFATGMNMGREGAIRRISYHRGRAGDFVSQAVEHAALDTGHWGGFPRDLRGMHGDPLRKIGIQFHELRSSVSTNIAPFRSAAVPVYQSQSIRLVWRFENSTWSAILLD
jgi:hypothetical protein